MNFYHVSPGEEDLSAIAICEPDEAKWEFKRALAALERFGDTWNPFRAELMGTPEHSLGAFSPTNLVGGIIGVTNAALTHDLVAPHLLRDAEHLPLDLPGHRVYLYISHRIVDGIDWEESSWHTISNGTRIVTNSVIREETIPSPGFFRTPSTWNQLYLAVDANDSFISDYSESGLRGLTFRRIPTTASKRMERNG